jgi:hypothetical protein
MKHLGLRYRNAFNQEAVAESAVAMISASGAVRLEFGCLG